MHILVDEALPDADLAFGRLGQLHRFSGRELAPDLVRHADALIVRSVTRVDSTLLSQSNVRFVGTATSGVDHIDQAYLAKRAICFADAAGCNSRAVAEYVLSAMLLLAERYKFRLDEKTLGIVGVGRIGSIVAAWARLIGMNVFLCDPPLSRRSSEAFVDCLTLARHADIVTFHVPLTLEGPDRTLDMIDAKWFSALKNGAFFINTSRGEIVREEALLNAIQAKQVAAAVLDVWRNEPMIDPSLVAAVEIATSHIAGYSVEAKRRAVWMIRDALIHYMRTSNIAVPDQSRAASMDGIIALNATAMPSHSPQEMLQSIIRGICDLPTVDSRLRELLQRSPRSDAEGFESARAPSNCRREFESHEVTLPGARRQITTLLSELGFRVPHPKEW